MADSGTITIGGIFIEVTQFQAVWASFSSMDNWTYM